MVEALIYEPTETVPVAEPATWDMAASSSRTDSLNSVRIALGNNAEGAIRRNPCRHNVGIRSGSAGAKFDGPDTYCCIRDPGASIATLRLTFESKGNA